MTRTRKRLALLGSAVALTAGALTPVQLAGAVPAAAAGSFQWAALGDSYTAGVIPASGDLFESPRDGCERTDRSYPLVIERDLGSLIDLNDVSCGAATIENVTHTAQDPIGRNLPPFSEDPDYPFPPVPAQSDAVTYGTDVITVGVGGNTLGFADILLKCQQAGGESDGTGTPCKDELAAHIPGRLTTVSTQYGQMLARLHEKAPDAKILAVGYPTVIPNDTSKCQYNNLREFASITRGDLDWLRSDVLEPLNTVIEKSAATQGSASFVDLYGSSRNHSVCDTDKWTEGIIDAKDNLSVVHPNAEGHSNAADLVSQAILNAISPS